MDELYEQLYVAIKAHSDLKDGSIIDASKYGADGGFHGFIYYDECEEFYNKNKPLIHEFAIEYSEQLGHKNWLEMVSNFKRVDLLQHDKGLENLMSWFVLEEVGRWLNEQKPNLKFDVEHDRASKISELYYVDNISLTEQFTKKLAERLSEQTIEELMELNDDPDEVIDRAETWLSDEDYSWRDYNESDDIMQFAIDVYQNALDMAVTNKTRTHQETPSDSQS